MPIDHETRTLERLRRGAPMTGKQVVGHLRDWPTRGDAWRSLWALVAAGRVERVAYRGRTYYRLAAEPRETVGGQRW